MTQQPEALRLADELDDIHTTHVARNAAAELRCLHASCEDYAQHKQRQDRRVLELNTQRDALLEACKAYDKWADKTLCYDRELRSLSAQIRAAIKAVEETK